MKRNVNEYRAIASQLPWRCSTCGSKKNLTVHHKDENPLNNDLSNLRILCKDCHNKIHGIVLKTKYPKKFQPTTKHKIKNKRKRN